MLVVALVLALVVVAALVVLVAVTLVWLFVEDPRREWPSRQIVLAPYAVAPPGPAWVRELPPSRTPWDVPPLVRAEIEIATLYRVIDLMNVPQLRPEWVAQTMRQIEAGL